MRIGHALPTSGEQPELAPLRFSLALQPPTWLAVAPRAPLSRRSRRSPSHTISRFQRGDLEFASRSAERVRVLVVAAPHAFC